MFITKLVKGIGAFTHKYAYKACRNSKCVRKAIRVKNRMLKPVTDMTATYKANKTRGKVKAIGTVFKENGVGGPIGAIGGATCGFATIASGGVLAVIPGLTEAGAFLGWYLGKGLETGGKYAIKTAAKVVTKAATKNASIFAK